MELNIKEHLLTEEDELTTEVEYKEGIRFKLRFIPRGAIQKLARGCMIWKYKKATKTREQELDTEKFAETFCRRAIVGWVGVTPRTLAGIVPLDLEKIPKDQLDTDITFTIENAIEVVKEAYDLDTFLQEAAVDVTLFKPYHGEELGNSEPSQSGS